MSDFDSDFDLRADERWRKCPRHTEAAPRPRFWRVESVAWQLGISVRKVWRLIAEKRLRAQKIGRCTVISEEELGRFAREELEPWIQPANSVDADAEKGPTGKGTE